MTYADFIPQGGHYAIDVGAHDGVFQSVTLGLEKSGWEVLCVEANPDLEAALRSHRRHVIMAAVGPFKQDHVPFYINEGAPASYSGLVPNEHCRRQVEVPQRTLTWCLDEVQFPYLDVLAMDIEGGELGALQGLDFGRWKPKTIFAENWAAEGDRKLADFLEPLGYTFKGKIVYDEVWVLNG